MYMMLLILSCMMILISNQCDKGESYWCEYGRQEDEGFRKHLSCNDDISMRFKEDFIEKRLAF